MVQVLAVSHGVLIVVAGYLLAAGDARAPWAVAVALGIAGVQVARTWIRARGTALRPAIVWAGSAIALAALAEFAVMNEPPGNGRPGANQWMYLSVLSALSAFLSVLNARSPGSGAWALLMVMLVVVFLLPWLEGSWMVRQRDGWDRLRLVFPWTWFLALLVIAGVTNYLPTKFGPAAAIAMAGFVLAWLALSRTDWSNESRGALWAWIPWCWSAAVCVASLLDRADRAARTSLDRVWLWFRDHWGAVWAIRTRDRFNATAKGVGWNFRLEWGGASAPDVPDEAAATFGNLLRRFADRERIEGVALAKPVPIDDHGQAS